MGVSCEPLALTLTIQLSAVLVSDKYLPATWEPEGSKENSVISLGKVYCLPLAKS